MASGSAVLVSVSVGIGGSTKITYQVHDDGLVEFSIGDGELDLLTTEPGLHNLAARTQEALHAVQGALARSQEGC